MKVDNQEAFLTSTWILVEVASIGKQLRDKRNKHTQSDYIILDYMESSKNTNTPDLRAKNFDRFNKVVMQLGDPKRMFHLHGNHRPPSRIVAGSANTSGFRIRVFSEIVDRPEREDLWEQFETIYRDPENDDRLEDAHELL